jgi:hypothetical protein
VFQSTSTLIEWFWPFGREEPHSHPPFYALVGLTSDGLAPSWGLLPRARLGPMIVFSLTYVAHLAEKPVVSEGSTKLSEASF